MPADVRLTPAQAAQLVAAREQIENAHRLLDRAERAGLDVSDHRNELARAEALRVGLLQEFAPKGVRQP